MEKVLTAIKNRIEWIEQEEGNLTDHEKKLLMHNLKAIDDELARCMLMHMAISK